MKNRYQIAALAVFMLAIIGLALYEADNRVTFGPVEVNKPAPAFSLKDTSGQLWDLAAMKGKVVFVNFWATWCPSCTQEMPSIHNLNVMAGGVGDFQILTVLYQDSPDKALQYFKDSGFAMPIVLDPTGITARMYGLTGVPETFIIDKKGILRHKQIGPREFDQPDVIQFLNMLVEEK